MRITCTQRKKIKSQRLCL